jgi:LysR family glycine cleavage system transcriptional activator
MRVCDIRKKSRQVLKNFMAENLPTLKGLRAFEEAFQLGSYTAAARRLNVQQPAISYQIKRLEEDLGVDLFIKEQGRLVPTAAAHQLYDTLRQSFDAIRRVSEKLRNSAKPQTFTIATYPGVGTYWLSNKLSALSRDLAIPVKVVTLVKDSEILNEEADCMILFGRGTWAGHESRLLMPEAVCPVGAPDLAETLQGNGDQTSPPEFTIIEQDDPEKRWICWEDWLDQTRETGFSSSDRMTVNDHGFALHMALTGAGVTLAWVDMVRDLLNSGSLVPLSDKIATSDAGYWLVARPDFFASAAGQTVLNTLTAAEMGGT